MVAVASSTAVALAGIHEQAGEGDHGALGSQGRNLDRRSVGRLTRAGEAGDAARNLPEWPSTAEPSEMEAIGDLPLSSDITSTISATVASMRGQQKQARLRLPKKPSGSLMSPLIAPAPCGVVNPQPTVMLTP